MIIAPRNSAGAWYFFVNNNLQALRRRMEQLRSIGARFVRFWIPWSEVEPEEGRFDFAYVNDILATIATTGLRLDVTLCSQMIPEWFWLRNPGAFPLNENGQPVWKTPDPKDVRSTPISLWHPEVKAKTEIFVNNCFASCLDRWSPLVLFLRISMGRFNEPTYPSKNHFWCYDRWAVQNFRDSMTEKYGASISELNRAWGRRFGRFENIDVPRPDQFIAMNGQARADFIDWYRDSKDEFVSWSIALLQARLEPHQKQIVFPSGADDADERREAFIRKGKVHFSLRHMDRNFWLIDKCRELGLFAQYAGIGLKVNLRFLGQISDRCREAGIPLWGQIPSLKCQEGNAANDPEAIAALITEFGLHGLAWNKDADVFYPPAQPNEKFNQLRQAYDLIAQHHHEALSSPALTSIKHILKPAGARVEWKTDRDCDGVVLYGTRQGCPGKTSSYEPIFRREHAVELAGLTPRVPYFYIVSSMDHAGRATCGRERMFSVSP